MSYTIYGFEGCGYFNAALAVLKTILNNKIQIVMVPKAKWQSTLQSVHKNHKLTKTNKDKVDKHFTSPLVIRGNTYIGGYDNLRVFLKL